MRKRFIMLASIALVLLSLACNFPGFPTREPVNSDAAATPTDTPTPDGGAAEEDRSDDDAPAPDDDMTSGTPTKTPTPTATATLSATATVTATPTLTITLTPTPVPPGPPLTFQDPAWELVEWHPVPDSGNWEGTLRLNIEGGTQPYRSQLEDQEIVPGLEVPARWRRCKAMPATVRVWSADGQMAEAKIWVWEIGCEDD